jgi:hypothetical protein
MRGEPPKIRTWHTAPGAQMFAILEDRRLKISEGKAQRRGGQWFAVPIDVDLNSTPATHLVLAEPNVELPGQPNGVDLHPTAVAI